MKSNYPVLVNDRIELNGLPDDIQDILLRRGLVTAGGKKSCFCGLIQSNKNTYVFFPRKMEAIYGNLPDIFSAIRKYSNHSDSLIDSEDEGDNLFGSDELSLVTNILVDYRLNGIYTKRNRLNRTNNGKPNWSRTIKKFSPFFGPKGPVYLDYSGSSSLNQADSETSRIHAYIIRQLDLIYGQVLFGSSYYKDDGLLPPQSLDVNYLFSTLNSELQKLYSDRDIRLIKQLIQYIQRIHGQTRSNLVIGIRGFHTLWEHMLKAIITGAVDINSEFSIPTYITSMGEHLEAPNKGQRTDIIIHSNTNDTYAIIDAKYYQATGLRTAPGWSDLLKQFFYAKAVKSLSPTSKIKNYFIFPGSKQVLSLAYMKKRNFNESDTEYADIECVYVDPHEVIRAYIEERTLENLSKQLIA